MYNSKNFPGALRAPGFLDSYYTTSPDLDAPEEKYPPISYQSGYQSTLIRKTVFSGKTTPPIIIKVGL